MAVQLTGLIEWLPRWLVLRMGCFQYFQDPRFLEALRSNNMRWDRQIWTLRSIYYTVEPPDMDIEVQFQAVGQQFEGIEVQNLDEGNSKMSLEVQILTFEGCFKTNMIFRNILEYSGCIPA